MSKLKLGEARRCLQPRWEFPIPEPTYLPIYPTASLYYSGHFQLEKPNSSWTTTTKKCMNAGTHFIENAWGTGLQAWLDPGVKMMSSVIDLCPSLCSALFCAGFVTAFQVSTSCRKRVQSVQWCIQKSQGQCCRCRSASLDYMPIPESVAAAGGRWYSRPLLKLRGQRLGNGWVFKEKSGYCSLPEKEVGGSGKQTQQGPRLFPASSVSEVA